MALRDITASILKTSSVSIDLRPYQQKLDKAVHSLQEYSQNRKDRAKLTKFDTKAMLDKAESILGSNSTIDDARKELTLDLTRELIHLLITSDDRTKTKLYRQFMAYEDYLDDSEVIYDVSHLVKETEENADFVADLVSAAMDRAGVTNRVSVEPYMSGDDVPEEGTNTFFINFGHGDGFTIFKEGQKIDVDDVMEGGDDLEDPSVQGAYFLTINELRKPGSTGKSKRIKLYTARPKKDNFKSLKTLPLNLFLSSSESDAEGIAVDGDRDLYFVITDASYLVQTLNTPTVKHYQVVKDGAPIYEIAKL